MNIPNQIGEWVTLTLVAAVSGALLGTMTGHMGVTCHLVPAPERIYVSRTPPETPPTMESILRELELNPSMSDNELDQKIQDMLKEDARRQKRRNWEPENSK